MIRLSLGQVDEKRSTKSQVDHIRVKSGDANSKQIEIDVKLSKIMI